MKFRKHEGEMFVAEGWGAISPNNARFIVVAENCLGDRTMGSTKPVGLASNVTTDRPAFSHEERHDHFKIGSMSQALTRERHSGLAVGIPVGTWISATRKSVLLNLHIVFRPD